MTFGARDNFVPIEETTLNPEHLLPAWTKEMMNRGKPKNETEAENDDVAGLDKVNANETIIGCPGDPTGRECLSGSDGVDGVHEISIFAPKKDRNSKRLEAKGVLVDDWGMNGGGVHNWNRAAEDHPAAEQEDSKKVDWTKLHKPQWAYENTVPVFGDKFMDGEEYKHQVQVSQSYRPRDDHFADWKAESDKNMDLVYGEGAIARNKVWNSKEKKFVDSKWTFDDDHLNATDAAAQLNSNGPRTGEPFRDGLMRTWSGANGVGASDHNLDVRSLCV
jgi:hypothetical protein